MQVLKFGGSSVANAINIKKVAEILRQEVEKEPAIVVISALGGITDLLLQSGYKAAAGNEEYKEIAREIEQRHITTIRDLLPVNNQSSLLSTIMQRCHEAEDICNGIFLLKEFSNRTKDRLVCFGELMSSLIISAYLNSAGLQNVWKDSRELICTNSFFTKATVDFADTNEKVQSYFQSSQQKLTILPGFIASDTNGNTTTLGRGGSDYTASIIGAAINASQIQIWTDVSGLMTADPRVVNNAKPILNISYQEVCVLMETPGFHLNQDGVLSGL